MALTQVKSDGIATGAVTADQIAANAVTVDDIADGSISTAKLADDAVTADKLADTAVTAGSYTFANVTVDAQGRITAASSGTVSSDAISEGNTSAEVVDTGSDGHFKVVTEGTEAVRVDASQRLLVGRTTAPVGTLCIAGRSDGASNPPFIRLDLANATPADGAGLGVLAFGTTSDNSENRGANITALRDGGTWTANSSLPTRLAFYTAADGSDIPTERMRIKSDGKIGISATSPATLLQIGDSSTGNGTPQIRLHRGSGSDYLNIDCSGGSSFFDQVGGGNMRFATGGTERMRLIAAGFLKVSNTGTFFGSTSGYHERVSSLNSTTTVDYNSNASFDRQGFIGAVGTISCARSATSDYSLFCAYSNAYNDTEFNLRGDGNAYADNSWNGGGADYAEYFEWSDGNTSAEDRRGISVVLDGDKIREAVAGEDPIGVISGNPSVVGDADIDRWKEKYLRDDFGTYVREEHNVVRWTDEEGKEHNYEDWNIPADVVVPDDAIIETHDSSGNRFSHRALNPAYDPDLEYVSREDRPEWDCVGLMGKLRIRKGQVTGSRWIKMRDVSDTVEEWLVR